MENVLREALAMGADEAYMISDEALTCGDPSVTAKALSQLAMRIGQFNIYLTGESSMDMLSRQVPPRLSVSLNVPIVTYVRELEVNGDTAIAVRDLENYTEKVEVKLPALFSVTGEINQPRLPTLLQIRRAFMKPLKKLKLQDVTTESLKPNVNRVEVKLLKVVRKNVLVEGEDVDELADKLVENLLKEGVLKV